VVVTGKGTVTLPSAALPGQVEAHTPHGSLRGRAENSVTTQPVACNCGKMATWGVWANGSEEVVPSQTGGSDEEKTLGQHGAVMEGETGPGDLCGCNTERLGVRIFAPCSVTLPDLEMQPQRGRRGTYIG
jgi:hypothetical protein